MAFLVVGVIAAGCGVQAKSAEHAAGVCDSVKPLFKTKSSMGSSDARASSSSTA